MWLLWLTLFFLNIFSANALTRLSTFRPALSQRSNQLFTSGEDAHDSSGLEAQSSSDIAREKTAELMNAVRLIDGNSDAGGDKSVMAQPPKKDPFYMTSREILAIVKETEQGASANQETKELVTEYILNKLSPSSVPGSDEKEDLSFDISSDSLLFGNYEVSYVGEGDRQRNRGNPAGGNYRGVVGRLLYKNSGLYQHIQRVMVSNTFSGESESGELGSERTPFTAILREVSDKEVEVVNYVSGLLLGFFPLRVVLKGRATKVTLKQRLKMVRELQERKPATERGEQSRWAVTEEASAKLTLSQNTVEAKFESPRIFLGFGSVCHSLWRMLLYVPRAVLLALRMEVIDTQLVQPIDALFTRICSYLNLSVVIGPTSTVVLDTPFVDENLRIGVGGRGSLFLFGRIEDDSADSPSYNDISKELSILPRLTPFAASEGWKAVIEGPAVNGRGVGLALLLWGIYKAHKLQQRVAGGVLTMLGALLVGWKGGIVNGDADDARMRARKSRGNYSI